ncbi:Retrovirus-related Pol polyprotein from transposon TNT 1-94 [Apostasia shenzhenica]|uniref:Retrovirus-related Pol polyprotein from transposon TNT 1-94 n=1 Tax=Apostasia shenzhenica TaxID=1088818 RepID=A0A2I0A1T8_9ASPA|nr:Retrovirus-related Pol polyprotein from transposon TNT 1-94 [Apostasia shenzhenica]
MSEGANLLEHMNVFSKMISQLRSINVKLEEENEALLLLSSLPKSYDHLVTTILYGKDTLKVEEVNATLLSNEVRNKQSTGESLTVKTSQDRGRSKNKFGNQYRYRSISKENDNRCYYCKKEGHWKRDCPKKSKQQQQKKSGEEASVASRLEKDSETLCTFSCMDSSDSWILDSDCSYHMCPFRDWFSTYSIHDGGRVIMGNNSECKSVGIGTIKIKMFDGVIRTLTEVRHVPDLRKGLISLGTLDASGCTFIGSDGIIKVKKGAPVVMKGEKIESLYRLIGKTITGDIAVTSSTDDDDTMLWHARLGHMSERGLLELHNRKLLKGIKSCKIDFCEFCVLGKQCRVKFVTSNKKSKNILEYVHSDV